MDNVHTCFIFCIVSHFVLARSLYSCVLAFVAFCYLAKRLAGQNVSKSPILSRVECKLARYDTLAEIFLKSKIVEALMIL